MNAPLVNLYRQVEDYFFRGISSKCLNLDNRANAYMTGVPVADLNLVYITKNTASLDKILNKGKQFYDQSSLSFVVVIPQEFCTSDVEGVFSSMGYHQTGKSVSMAVKLDDFRATALPAFFDEIIIRGNDEKLNDWMTPLIGAFESTIEISSIYAVTHENALNKEY